MDTINNPNSNEPEPGNPAPASSKLGIIGIIIGVLGAIVYCLPLAYAFVMGAAGNPPAPTDPLTIGLGLVSYCGAGVGIIGGVLGGVSLARGENKTFGIIALVLAILLLCTCAALAFTGALISA